MTRDEYNLLENLLMGLDRLYDSESKVLDLYALIFATSRALVDTEYFSILQDTSNALENLVTSKDKVRDDRREALGITDDLRVFIAKKLDPVFRQEISR